MTREEKLERIKSRQWYHSIEIEPDLVTPGTRSLADMRRVLGYLDLPERLDGLAVLDIGAWDGFFSFEAFCVVHAPIFFACRVKKSSR